MPFLPSRIVQRRRCGSPLAPGSVEVASERKRLVQGPPCRKGFPDRADPQAEALEGMGFEVAQAERGEAALEAIRRPGACCDALVTDYAMPGMTGGELVQEARRLRPGLPALVVTGYAEARQLGTVPGGVAVAHKPFRMDELAERVAGLVEAAGTAVAARA